MSKPVKIIGLIAALLSAPFVIAFIYGGYLAATGQYEPPTEADAPQPIQASSGQVETAEAQPKINQSYIVETSTGGAGLPAALTPRSVTEWLIGNGYIAIEGEIVKFSPGKFQALNANEAVTIYRAFRNGPEANQFSAVRKVFFALCSELPPAERRAFAAQAGAVFPRRAGCRPVPTREIMPICSSCILRSTGRFMLRPFANMRLYSPMTK